MLDDLSLFIEVVRQGSFSKTAAALNLSVSTISKRLSHFEEKLGASLLIRTARGIRLTSVGEAVFDDLAHSLDHIQRKINNYGRQAIPKLRLLCPQNLFTGPLFSVLSKFQFKYPELELHVEPNNQNSLLSQNQFDLAIRVGEQTDSAFYQKRLGEIALRVVGKEPLTPRTQIFLPYKSNVVEKQVKFQEVLEKFRHQSYVGDITLCRMLVEQGNGCALLPMTEIAALSVDSSHKYRYYSPTLGTRPIYAMWPNSSSPIPMAGILIEMISEYCRNHGYLSGESINI